MRILAMPANGWQIGRRFNAANVLLAVVAHRKEFKIVPWAAL